MVIRQYEIWLADLNPRIGTEAGKTRPVLVVQTDLLNQALHPSTLVCPITSKVSKKSEILRVHLKSGMANLRQECDILMDQLRAIDNQRLLKKIGTLPDSAIQSCRKNLKIMLDLDE
ncbi:MAG: type II toxin-antitoxin system PemK/MazF family toxin [Bacteroidales bacterium]|nr:type II toxin-antitoxin system PemK/MazF family toxin [Bacteroidales bacterium]